MKKRQMSGWLVAGLLAAFVSSAVAQSATAYSSSAIGVIKKTIAPDQRVLLSIPLDQDADTGEGVRITDIPAFTTTNLPNGAQVSFWVYDDATGTYSWLTQTKKLKKWSGSITNHLIQPGEAFFLKNTTTSPFDFILSGEVPADPSISTGLPAGNRVLVANPYPTPIAFTNLSFIGAVSNGSQISVWDAQNGAWISQTKKLKKWSGQITNYVFQAGEGFFISSATVDTTWTEEKPYTWPQ